ncbi:hypothetical protein PAMA_012936 [Pampus argenteus]
MILAKLKPLQKISIFASFCGNFSMFESLLRDLNVTERFISIFPDNCNVTDDIFKNLRTMPLIKNPPIENTWINSSFMEVLLRNVWLSSLHDISFVNITYNEDTPDVFQFQFHTINHTINVRSITFDGLLCYTCDGVWYAKMLWVWIRMKRRDKKQSNLLKNVSFSYHAFISYSHQDSGWVDSQLLPSLEADDFSLCIHKCDFVPGNWIIDNIINCVKSSYKTLFVFSKHFIQSEWCNYELFFAQHRAISIQQDSLLFISLEPISSDCRQHHLPQMEMTELVLLNRT